MSDVLDFPPREPRYVKCRAVCVDGRTGERIPAAVREDLVRSAPASFRPVKGAEALFEEIMNDPDGWSP